ncbi:MAG TPA: CocE/NonD family hydrolase [Candidatus Solibacter sp.]|nr:CocE/NonD family hydrolase [Candidatus Solibacter sp.]
MRKLAPALVLLSGALAHAAKPAIVKHLAVPVAMRDGVRLAANAYVPSEHGRFPTILVRTPYNKDSSYSAGYESFTDHGYAVVVQDVRGRYASEGAFQPLTQEIRDGDDTLNWIARQPWSDGKVGMIGGSYSGITQWKAALSGNPHLKAIFPVVSGWDEYRDRYYSTGGAFKLGYRLEWLAENLRAPGYHQDFGKFVLHLPIRSADVQALGWTSPLWRDVMDHPSDDAFWRSVSTRDHIDRVKVPVFSVGGWYDNFVQSDLEAYAALHQRNGLNRIVVGPWPHNMSIPFDGIDLGAESLVAVRALQVEWFDQWLKGKDSALLSKPPLKFFVMGANKWREEQQWPPEGAQPRNFYLQSGGKANSLNGDGELADSPGHKGPSDTFEFDPLHPVPTRGGAVCCNPKIFPWGPYDQRAVEERKDVLVYSTKALKQPVEVAGPVSVTLSVSTNAKDTDFTAKLVDVFPDGMARNLTDGILRLRYRNSLAQPELVKPGELYKITVDAGVTSNVFMKGHKIRLEVSSSNFPRFDRNPNTGGVVASATRLIKANQIVFHDANHPSYLTMLVMK